MAKKKPKKNKVEEEIDEVKFKVPFYAKLLFLFFSVFFALLIFELFLRFFVPTPENLAKLKSSNLFLHENNPSRVFRHASSEFDNEIRINSSGFRDDEFSAEKGDDVYRIAVLGDSQEEALQVALENTWQKVMAGELTRSLDGKKSKYRRVETYSFGISGYGTDQQWLTLREKVWQFKPDMIVLGFSPNDVGDTYKNGLVRIENGQIHLKSAKERAGGNILGKAARELYMYHLVVRAASANVKSKHAVDVVRTKILGFPKEERFFLSDAQLVQGPFEVVASQKRPPNEVLEAWVVIRALVSDMKKQSDDHGAKFVIAVNIPRAQIQGEDWENLKAQYHLGDDALPYEINLAMGRIASEFGIPFVDGREEAISWYKQEGLLHFPLDGHFNENGNKYMGTTVANFIIKNKLISN